MSDPWHSEKVAHIMAGILFERPWVGLSNGEQQRIRHCIDTVNANSADPASVLPDCMAPDGAAPCEGFHAVKAERNRFERLFNLRTRQMMTSTEKWVEAAEKALATGDTRELRMRIDLAKDKSVLAIRETM